MKLPVFFSKSLKRSARSKSLMINEAKRTPKTDFLVNTFALQSERTLCRKNPILWLLAES